jgi:hypothetical protein
MYKITDIDSKPKRTLIRKSKYMPILATFLASKKNLSKLEIEHPFITTYWNLKYQIKKHDLNINIHLINHNIYLEKADKNGTNQGV